MADEKPNSEILIREEMHRLAGEMRRALDSEPRTGKREYVERGVELAQALQEWIQKAPPIVSNNPELDELAAKLDEVPAIIAELLAGPPPDADEEARERAWNSALLADDPRKKELRVSSVTDLHAMYQRISGDTDWCTLRNVDGAYTNPFFDLARRMYQLAGLEMKDKTIEADITAARRYRT